MRSWGVRGPMDERKVCRRSCVRHAEKSELRSVESKSEEGNRRGQNLAVITGGAWEGRSRESLQGTVVLPEGGPAPDVLLCVAVARHQPPFPRPPCSQAPRCPRCVTATRAARFQHVSGRRRRRRQRRRRGKDTLRDPRETPSDKDITESFSLLFYFGLFSISRRLLEGGRRVHCFWNLMRWKDV